MMIRNKKRNQKPIKFMQRRKTTNLMSKDTNDDIIIINIKLIDINNIKCRKSKYHTTIICNNFLQSNYSL